jgi:hypothetical protein
MFEQIVLSASEYVATLFILFIMGIIATGVFWAKVGVYRK